MKASMVKPPPEGIHLMWEATQAIIAIAVTLATLYVAVQMAISGNKAESAFLLLSNAFFSVISFYVWRSNGKATNKGA